MSGPKDWGSIAVMYGAFPDTQSPRYPDPGSVIPQFTEWLAPKTKTANTLQEDIKARVAWLENELRMHEAYKLELETLTRVLAAYEEPK